MVEQHSSHSSLTAGFCDCVEPQPIDDWISIGSPGTAVECAVCNTCGCPIPDPQVTYQESDMEG